MTTLTPIPGWDDVVQLETTTAAQGGPGGIANAQAQALLDRTAYLESTNGASKVGYDGGTLQDVADYAKPLTNYAALRTYTGRASAVQITGLLGTAQPQGIAGRFALDTTDTTSGAVFTGSISGTTLTVSAVSSGALAIGQAINRGDTGATVGYITAGSGLSWTLSASATIGSMVMTADNGGTVIVAANGQRWKREYSGKVNIQWFEADPFNIKPSGYQIQAAIDYASNLNGDNPVTKGAVSKCFAPNGQYQVERTIYIGWSTYSNTSAFRYCDFEGESNAEFVYTGAAQCMIIGNNTSYGVLPINVKNLKFSRADKAVGTVALLAQGAGYCNIENIGVTNFESGLYLKGCIGAKVDGKMSFINSTNCITIESYQPDAAVLRFASNNVSVKNYHVGDGASVGTIIRTGSGVSPSGAGGLIELHNITYESMDSAGTAIYVAANGETVSTVNQLDTVLIDHCWFENAGAVLVDLVNAVAKVQYCWFGPQSAGSPVGICRMNDNFSSFWLDQCYGYMYSTPIVAFAGTATASIAKERVYIGHYRKYNSGTDILFSDWPVNTLGVRPVARKEFAIKYNSTYPAGNVDTNALLTLDIAAEAIKMFGTGWSYLDVTFVAQANVSAANTGRVSLRVYNNNSNALYSMSVTEAGTSTAYTITGTSIQFGTGATSIVWTQMIGVWTCHTANGQY